MSISNRARFEVFKRDNFRCKYCGATPEDGKLEVDHVVPRASGGADSLKNLITACKKCNSGKSDLPLPKDKNNERLYAYGFVLGVIYGHTPQPTEEMLNYAKRHYWRIYNKHDPAEITMSLYRFMLCGARLEIESAAVDRWLDDCFDNHEFIDGLLRANEGDRERAPH